MVNNYTYVLVFFDPVTVAWVYHLVIFFLFFFLVPFF
jgi:hypothetical protein